MNLLKTIGLPKGKAGPYTVDGVPDGFEAFALAQVVKEIGDDKPVIFVARDGQKLPALIDALAFVAPDLPVLDFPAWDCLPYDRVSPGADAAARRLDADLADPVVVRLRDVLVAAEDLEVPEAEEDDREQDERDAAQHHHA